MSLITDKIKSYLDGEGIKYDYFPSNGDDNEALKIGYNAKNTDTISVIFFFDKDANSVNVKSFSIAKVPAAKIMDVYVVLNELNAEYRWVKFYIDSDNEITVSGDAIFEPATAGAECLEITLRYINIIDEVFPRIMKALWS